MKTTIVSALFSLSLLSGSCAHLREGWMKVDFIEGEPSPIMLCKMELVKGDLTAKCASLEAIREEMKRQEREKDGSL